VDAPRPHHATTAGGDRVAPGEVRGQALASSALVAAAAALFLCPTIGPLTLALGPLAWILGALDRRGARAVGQRQQLTGEMGLQIGRGMTLVVAVIVGIYGVYHLSRAMR